MLAYEFMRRALLVGIVLALALPLIGTPIILRKTSMTGDALAHSSLAGVAFGLVSGLDPVFGALLACILSALCIENIRNQFPQYADLSIAVVSAIAAGIAGVLSSFSTSARSLEDFLFGSIVAVSNYEVVFVCIVGLLTILFSIFKQKQLFLLSLDTNIARTSGVNVRVLSILFAVITAAIISISARAIGTLVVSSVLVLPVACAIQVSRSYVQTQGIALGISVCTVILGICSSYWFGLRPGGTIVLLGALSFVVCLCISKWILKR